MRYICIHTEYISAAADLLREPRHDPGATTPLAKESLGLGASCRIEGSNAKSNKAHPLLFFLGFKQVLQ